MLMPKTTLDQLLVALFPDRSGHSNRVIRTGHDHTSGHAMVTIASTDCRVQVGVVSTEIDGRRFVLVVLVNIIIVMGHNGGPGGVIYRMRSVAMRLRLTVAGGSGRVLHHYGTGIVQGFSKKRDNKTELKYCLI